MRRMRRTATAVTAMAVLAAACGDDDGGGGQAQTEEGAIEAVEAGVGGALRGNSGQVLNFMNAECRESVDSDDVQLALGLAQAFLGDLFEDFDLSDVQVQASVLQYDGDTARLETSYFTPDGEPIDETLGLSSETYDVVYENGKWVDTGCEFGDSFEDEGEDLQAALSELGYAATREDPIPNSVAAPIGGGFVASIDAIDVDAFDALSQTDGFISEPEPGQQYVLATVTVGYQGDEEPESLNSVSGQVIGGSSAVGYDSFGCGSFPSQLTSGNARLFTGGRVTGDLCFPVPSDEIDGMQISLSAGFGSDTIIFDPTVDPATPVEVPQSSGPSPLGRLATDRANPIALGEAVPLGEGWTITVRGVELDATASLVAADEFTDAAPAGKVFTLVDYELAYDGTDEPQSGFSVDVVVVGDSNVSGSDDCAVSGIPDEIDRFADVFAGGSISGNDCFTVDAADVDSLVLYASADFFGDSASILALR